MSTDSQCAEILRHLQRGRSLTALQALSLCNSMRCAARIHDLRKRGHDIVTTPVEHDGKRFARYSLVRKARAA